MSNDILPKDIADKLRPMTKEEVDAAVSKMSVEALIVSIQRLSGELARRAETDASAALAMLFLGIRRPLDLSPLAPIKDKEPESPKPNPALERARKWAKDRNW